MFQNKINKLVVKIDMLPFRFYFLTQNVIKTLHQIVLNIVLESSEHRRNITYSFSNEISTMKYNYYEAT